MQSLQKISVESTVDVIVGQIIANIINGSFQPGQRIPTEAALAASLGVGRNSVREAIKILTAYGILEIRRADGTFVRSGFSPKMLDPMLYGIILDRDAGDLIEVRKAVENYAYHLASEKATEADILLLKQVLRRYDDEIHKEPCDYKRLADLDSEFHNTVSRCGHNQILTKINEIVCLLLYESRMQTIKAMIERGDKQFLSDIHHKSYDVIRYRKLDQVDQVVNEGIMNWDTYLKSFASRNKSEPTAENTAL